MSIALDEIVLALRDPEISEVGGGHNQKGIEFQKNWAIVKMIALKKQSAVDFLFLFEAVQDVAILDSPSSPTTIEVFQVKKKDRTEWSWSSLTNLHTPDDPSKPKKGKPKKPKPLDGVEDSPIGKLFFSISGFVNLAGSGRFISNAGCNISLASGGNAATSLPVRLSELSAHYASLLKDAIESAASSVTHVDLSKLFLEKVDIPVDDPQTYTIGVVHTYLDSVSPTHAGQARSFVESLLAKLGPLGAKTARATSIEEMRTRHGFSLQQLNAAFTDLENTPDVDFHLKLWLDQLSKEGLPFWQVSQILAASSGVFSRRLLGGSLAIDTEISAHCDAWLSTNKIDGDLMPTFKDGTDYLQKQFPLTKKAELQALLLLKAIDKCADLS